MKIFAVIPALNEAVVIKQIISQVKPLVDRVVLVNDGSDDQTGILAQGVGAEVLNHQINRGQGAALQTGISYALGQGADIVVTFDADGQHRADEIKKLIEPIVSGGYDVVLGSRFIGSLNQVPMAKKALLKIATALTGFYTGLKITDTHNGLRAFSRKAAEKINITQSGMAHASEILEQIGKHRLKYCEVPVTVVYTAYSKNKGQKISEFISNRF